MMSVYSTKSITATRSQRAFLEVQQSVRRAFILSFLLLLGCIHTAHAQTITQIIDGLGDGGENFSTPLGIAVDGTGNVYVSGRTSDNAFLITPGGAIVEIITATGDGSGNDLLDPEGVAVDGAGNVYVTGTLTGNVFKLDPVDFVATLIIDAAGAGGGDLLNYPNSVAVDGDGNVFVTGNAVDKVFKITPLGVKSVIVGPTGDGLGNTLDRPYSVQVDAVGNAYFVGTLTNNAFKVTPSGTITQIIDATGDKAGNGLSTPAGLALDAFGNVYVSGKTSNNVFKITPDGVITQIIDTTGDGLGNSLLGAEGLAVDASGNVYVTGQTSDNVFSITPGGLVKQIIDAAGDGGVGSLLDAPTGVAVDNANHVFVYGLQSNNVFKIDVTPSYLDADVEALVALYNSTDGANWTNNANWLTAAPVDTWYGITISVDSDWYRVTQIDLSNNNLVGVFPPEWNSLMASQQWEGPLGALETLELYTNQISGGIPSVIGNLDALIIVSLYNNNLSGSIPASLGTFNSLTRLSLYQNQLSGPIPDLSGSALLESLGLGDNNLTGGIPSTLGSLLNLTALDLQLNQFAGAIPTSLGNLTNLSLLRLNDNQLTGDVPESLKSLIGLADLRLNGNMLTGLPDMSGISPLSNFPVENNYLSFEDVEPNVGIPGFSYSPQAKIGTVRSESVGEGQSLSLEIPVGGSFNQYQWFKNGGPISGANSSSYLISSATALDAGTYTLQVSNTLATALTLTSEPITVSVTALAPTITVVSPNGGETWTTGTTQSILWSSVNVTGNVEIQLWRSGQRVLQATTGLPILPAITPNTGSFDWLIPANLTAGGGYRIVVTSLSFPGVLDQSNLDFTLTSVVQPQITVTRPNGGQTWDVGTTELILWSSSNVTGNVKIDLFRGGSLERVIAASQPNTGSFAWPIPNDIVEGNTYTIRVTSVGNSSVFDESDAPFTLQVIVGVIEIAVVRPNGGEVWTLGTTEQIRWTSSNLPDNIRIELLRGLSLDRVIAASAANTGSFNWSIPSDLVDATTYRIRLSGVTFLDTVDESDNPFTLQAFVPPTVPDRDALVALYNAAGGSNWANRTNWLSAAPLGTWYGVQVITVGETERVSTIDLSNNNLNGVLPAAWTDLITQDGALSELRRLLLPANQLGGSLLPVIGSLPALEELLLFGNAFTGSIPSQFTNLSGLRALQLQDNLLTGSLPQTMGNLSQLQTLYLRNNQLSGALPSSMGSLASLEVMEIEANQFSGAFPSWIPTLSMLRELHLTGNAFTGSIPAAIGNLSNLEILALGQNQLSSTIPPEIGNLTHLTWLSLGGQDIHGSIPTTLGNLTNLNLLTCSEANLSGTLPTELGNLTNLTFLHLGNNGLTGSIPATLGNLKKVEVLILFHNQLSGTIPSELGNMSSLTELAIQSNGLTGAVPGSFSGLSNMEVLQIFGNSLDGLPDLSGLPFLTDVFAQDNRFTFEDLEPNASISNFQYVPQATFGQASALSRIEGDSFALSMPVGGASNQYQWRKAGSPISGATSASLQVSSAALSDSGVYTLSVTNPLLPGLTLQSEAITVTIEALTIVVTEPEDVSPTAGSDVPLSAELPAAYNPQTREICFRRTGEAAYQCLPLSSNGTLNTGAIPGGFITERGVDYFYRFVLAQSTTTVPRDNAEANPFRLLVPLGAITSPFAIVGSTYSMISVPVELTDPSISAVLPDVGTSSAQRLLRWNTQAEQYDEAPNLTASFSPGTAFWFISTVASNFTVSGGTTVDPSQPFPIRLLPGWSQIGNPFAFTVSWSDVLNSLSVDAPVRYDPLLDPSDPYRYNQTTIEPWTGYWVNNPLTQAIDIQVQPIESSSNAGKHAARASFSDIASYIVQLEASLSNFRLRDTQNYLGFAEGATEGYDTIDFAEAPNIGSHVRLSIIEDGTRMAGSFKSTVGPGQEWRIELTAKLATELPKSGEYAHVRLNEEGVLPSEYQLYVFDDDEGERLPLVESAFGVNLTRDRPVRHLRIIVGTVSFASEVTDDKVVTPQSFTLQQNYPNPFNPATMIRYQLSDTSPVRLEVFNALGQQVRVLVDGQQDAGWYQISWDGRDEGGRQTASGLYFYRIRTTGFTDTKSMVLLR